MQITTGQAEVCWKTETGHSSIETMLFWVAAGSFDRLQKVQAHEKEFSVFSDNCVVFISRSMWRVSGCILILLPDISVGLFCFCGCFVIVLQGQGQP